MFVIDKVDGNALYYTCLSCQAKCKCVVKDFNHNVFLNLTCPHCLASMNVRVTAEGKNKEGDFSWTPVINTELLEKPNV